MISLEPMTPAAFEAAQRRMWRSYRASWTQSGASAAEAEAKEVAVRQMINPGGALPPGHHPLSIVVGDDIVGSLWLAERVPGDWYVYDLDISAEYRGRGLGRAALAAAEQFARSRAAVKLELQVFAHNTVMREICRTADYQPMTMTLAKAL